MRFELSDEAAALRDAAAGLLAAEVTPAVIRAGWPGGDDERPGGARPGAVWRKLAALGAVGTLVPEEHGGLGLDENSLVPLLEEIGRSGLPGPAVETIAVAAPLLPPCRTSWRASHAGGRSGMATWSRSARLPRSSWRRDGDSMLSFGRNDLDLIPQATVDGSRMLARAAGLRTAEQCSPMTRR